MGTRFATDQIFANGVSTSRLEKKAARSTTVVPKDLFGDSYGSTMTESCGKLLLIKRSPGPVRTCESHFSAVSGLLSSASLPSTASLTSTSSDQVVQVFHTIKPVSCCAFFVHMRAHVYGM